MARTNLNTTHKKGPKGLRIKVVAEAKGRLLTFLWPKRVLEGRHHSTQTGVREGGSLEAQTG